MLYQTFLGLKVLWLMFNILHLLYAFSNVSSLISETDFIW